MIINFSRILRMKIFLVRIKNEVQRLAVRGVSVSFFILRIGVSISRFTAGPETDKSSKIIHTTSV